ncbi:nucleotidyl transferase AbiEii/AbiGii toxin family protein [Polynucleobacter sp. JS-JIR-II-c23]|uniref:nucleotidyl transferase AbiEii/AbiGii toxin family protein n=1 Tax=Polynucleobacter sp. JS-JIR-II-c23 TaxID=1758393 RepID=UPI002B222987|nr:nucleotidyl transferase AbiEii/AbiGii toxin family protein [Polynucleobacter sp. JS-JIR-II-c23]MEA9604626.1 nucleotidyl transferase AbiEii/AbiGii toxin family protein [Polynucleobacter sp. JS-JIR-II-c23]
MLLHDHKDFRDLIAAVSDAMGIDPTLVEKDYWIMHCLWGVQQQGFAFELKGGTSLSKGFGLIHRFSEDIDIRIEPPAGMDVKTGKNQDKEVHIKSRADYYDWVASELKISGIQEVIRDHAFDDQEKMRSGGIRLNYLSTTPLLSGLKDGVLLELGFDDTAPNQAVDISSWAYDYAIKYVKGLNDNRAKDVLCYLPEYTFVEKLQTITTKYRQYKEGKIFPKNFLRHYYDLYCLLDCPSVLGFIKTDRYQTRKIERFPKSDYLVISQNPAFLLSDSQDRKLFESEYLKVASLYYQGQPSFGDLLNRIGQHIHSL